MGGRGWRALAGAAVLAAIVIGAGPPPARGSVPWLVDWGRQWAADEAQGRKVVAIVNGEPVRLSEVLHERNWQRLVRKDDSIGDRAAFEKVLRNRLLLQEARRRGVVVTEQEVRRVAKKARADSESIGDGNEMVESFARGLGMSVEQYWRQQMLLDSLAERLRAEADVRVLDPSLYPR